MLREACYASAVCRHVLTTARNRRISPLLRLHKFVHLTCLKLPIFIHLSLVDLRCQRNDSVAKAQYNSEKVLRYSFLLWISYVTVSKRFCKYCIMDQLLVFATGLQVVTSS